MKISTISGTAGLALILQHVSLLAEIKGCTHPIPISPERFVPKLDCSTDQPYQIKEHKNGRITNRLYTENLNQVCSV